MCSKNVRRALAMTVAGALLALVPAAASAQSAPAPLLNAGKPGANTVPFSGKVKGKAMKRGTYRVTAVAVSPSGVKSASVSAGFKVTR